MVLPHCNLCLPGSCNSSGSASSGAGITDAYHHAWLIFVLLLETGFHLIGQAGLELLISSDLPASASQSAGITGLSHRARPTHIISFSTSVLLLTYSELIFKALSIFTFQLSESSFHEHHKF
uniref:Uncharacterized protein n=1 Tax=Callithrix jacchus TaxID=9483 RepID=A0A8I3W144_CALJA